MQLYIVLTVERWLAELQLVGNMRAASRDRGVPGLVLLLLLLLVTETESVLEAEMMADLRELRREVEQVRNEVRRVEEPGKQSEKNGVVLSWLVDTVKELQSELRALETRAGQTDSRGDQADQMRLLREEVTQLRAREEENMVTLHLLQNIVEREVRVNMTTISDKFGS